MATDRHKLAIERHLGSEEGEAFDRCLREAERAEREERLSRIAWEGADWCEPVPAFPEALALHADLAATAAEAAVPGTTVPMAPGAAEDETVLANREAAQAAGAARGTPGSASGAAGALPNPRPLLPPRFAPPTLPPDMAEPGRRAPALNVLQLRREVERLSHFHDSVQRSRAWRLTQSLRRLVGRAW